MFLATLALFAAGADPAPACSRGQSALECLLVAQAHHSASGQLPPNAVLRYRIRIIGTLPGPTGLDPAAQDITGGVVVIEELELLGVDSSDPASRSDGQPDPVTPIYMPDMPI